jgi:hypothetical protein
VVGSRIGWSIYTKTTKTEYAKKSNYWNKVYDRIEKRYCMNSIEITGRLGRCFARILAVIDTTISKIKILQFNQERKQTRKKNHRILSELNFEDRIKAERKPERF